MPANEIALKWAPRGKQARIRRLYRIEGDERSIRALLDELASQVLTHGSLDQKPVT